LGCAAAERLCESSPQLSLTKGIFGLSNQFLIRVALVLAATALLFPALGQNKAPAVGTPSVDAAKQEPREEAASQKYREIFFPQGMPVEKDPDSGEQKKSLYAFYGEAKIADSFLAVLYSKKISSREGDADYAVYLGLLAKSDSGWSVSQTLDLTEYMPVETEAPGNFYKMDGRTNSFTVAPGVAGLHVNLWAVLAGTGSVSGASDLFFRMAPEHKLEMVLSLKGTSKYFRIGTREFTIVNSTILVGDVNGDGKTEIVVEKNEVESVQGKRQVRSEKPVLYKLVDDKYKLDGTIEKSEITGHAHGLIQLARSKFIRIAGSGDTAAETKN
jgi:hypothetical protein